MKTKTEGSEEHPAHARASAEETPTTRLIAEIGADMKTLAEKHWSLARAELKADLADDLSALRVFGVGIVAALLGVNVLVTAGVLALANVIRGWLAALLVAAPLLMLAVATGLFAYRRVQAPLARTRRALQKDVVLAREHL